MFKTVSVLLLVASLYAKESYGSLEKDFYKLSLAQKATLQQAYYAGVADDVGWSMASIAWKESMIQNETIPINLQDPSCGVFHNNVNSVMERHTELRDTGFNRNRICARLINDFDFASKEAISELKFWLRYYKGNFYKSWGSYNAGFGGNKKYANSILRRLKILKRHLRVN